MAVVKLDAGQIDAINRMKNGSICCGTTGSGKSRTGLAYFYKSCGGEINSSSFVPMKHPRDLYIITTAKKRESLEWEGEMCNFYMSTDPKYNHYKNMTIVVDSWNNITKYMNIKGAFFIFDEQRVIGKGVWVKAFLTIAKNNRWILLSATPGDTWMDYIPVFIANGFFKNRTDFYQRHVVFSRFTKYPKVERYINEARLIKMRDLILVNLDYTKKTVPHKEVIIVDYDKQSYDIVAKRRWNIYTNEPITSASEYCYVLRKIVNSSPDRQIKLLDIVQKKKKVIIFYSYDYELDILHNLFEGNYPMAECNGHKHQPLPTGDHWVYLVQYAAGAEAWNCTTTDTIVFFSQTYSYKVLVQSSGRIDRRNTPYIDLYYYHLKTNSRIDSAISKTLTAKKQFSEKGFAPKFKDDKDEVNSMHLKLKVVDRPFNNIVDAVEEYNNWEDPSSPMYADKEKGEN